MLESLPNEILVQIFLYLPTWTICKNISPINKRIYGLTKHHSLWRDKTLSLALSQGIILNERGQLALRSNDDMNEEGTEVFITKNLNGDSWMDYYKQIYLQSPDWQFDRNFRNMKDIKVKNLGKSVECERGDCWMSILGNVECIGNYRYVFEYERISGSSSSLFIGVADEVVGTCNKRFNEWGPKEGYWTGEFMNTSKAGDRITLVVDRLFDRLWFYYNQKLITSNYECHFPEVVYPLVGISGRLIMARNVPPFVPDLIETEVRKVKTREGVASYTQMQKTFVYKY